MGERVSLVSLLTLPLVDLAVCGELDIHVHVRKFDLKKTLESAQLFVFIIIFIHDGNCLTVS